METKDPQRGEKVVRIKEKVINSVKIQRSKMHPINMVIILQILYIQ